MSYQLIFSIFIVIAGLGFIFLAGVCYERGRRGESVLMFIAGLAAISAPVTQLLALIGPMLK